ncbi:MAG: ADP-ribose-binding protein [Desulfuromonadales bacterium]|jgi:hypothetical protein
MHEIFGDLWEEHRRGAIVAITTGGLVDRHGRCVMLRGCARQAKERFPDLPHLLGELLRAKGNHVFALGRGIVSFPVETSPYDRPELRLIERSCRELVELADRREWRHLVVPRPGCGGGGMEWADVRPILERCLDGRFRVITQK